MVLLLTYACVMCGLSLWLTKRRGGGADAFFVNNRASGTGEVCLSIVASCVGGSATLGMAGLAWQAGIPAVWWLGSGAIGLVVLSTFLARKTRETAARTMPEMIVAFIGAPARPVASGIIALAWLAILAAQFSAQARIIELMTGWDGTVSLVAGASILVLYAAIGGQAAVIRSDVIQYVLLLGGLLLALGWFISINPEALQHVPFELVNEQFPASRVTYFMLILGGSYVICPMLSGRLLSARTSAAAQRGGLLAVICLLATAGIIVALGLACRSLVPENTPVDNVLIAAIQAHLPAWASAVVLLGLFSAVISSADSCLITAATVCGNDLLRSSHPRVCRRLTVLIGLGGLGLALSGKSILGLLLMANDVYVCGVVVPVLVGMLLHGRCRFSAYGMVAAMVVGGCMGLTSALTENPQWSYAGLGSALLLSLCAIRGRGVQHALQASAVVLVLLSLTACSGKGGLTPSSYDPHADILDVQRMSQDLSVYAKRTGNARFLSEAEQAAYGARYIELFFAPWESNISRVADKDAYAPYFGSKKRKPKAGGYTAPNTPWSQAAWDAVVANANRAAFPSRKAHAILIRGTELRHVPTMLPRYTNPAKPGSGAPFDMFRASYLPLGMPVFVTHASRDGQWFFVENALTPGWVAASDVAIADKTFQAAYRSGVYMAFVREGVPVVDARFEPLFKSRVGVVLPRSGNSLLVPVADTSGFARITPVQVQPDPALGLTPQDVMTRVPMELTPETVARVGQQLMGHPYGWGGHLENRDCSAMLRDLFAPFGVWLPRNSRAQARAWEFEPFTNLTPEEKLARIRQAPPFITLLWLPGHIALYIGKEGKDAAMFHNMWGIRMRDAQGGDSGRHVVGKSVITTTRPGIELPGVADPKGLLNRMGGMSVLR